MPRPAPLIPLTTALQMTIREASMTVCEASMTVRHLSLSPNQIKRRRFALDWCLYVHVDTFSKGCIHSQGSLPAKRKPRVAHRFSINGVPNAGHGYEREIIALAHGVPAADHGRPHPLQRFQARSFCTRFPHLIPPTFAYAFLLCLGLSTE